VPAYIVASGSALPERVVSNEDLASQLGLTPEQILKSSGIRQRRWAEPGSATSQLAADALSKAISETGLTPADVDYLILGTMTPDRFIPGSAPAVQKSLGLPEIPCLDIRAACCNTLFGLQLARALITSKAAKHVAITVAEIQSAFLDLSPSAGTTSMLFGDGGAALIVSAQPTNDSLEIMDVFLGTDGSYVDDLGIRCPGSEHGRSQSAENVADFFPRMKGQSVIVQASRKLVEASKTVLQRNGFEASDVSWIVPHQANANLLAQVMKSLQIPNRTEVLVSIIEDTGNTSSASMGLALDDLRKSSRIKAGDLILLPAFGAGFMWGAALCRA
jgi:3-oxoacyl-[acyl-carrier-protein] synthase-3